MIMKNINFLKQPRRGNTHPVQLTPHKRSVVWGLTHKQSTVWGVSHKCSAIIALLLTAVTLLLTSCSKPEKKELAGSWQWACTSGGIAGVCYTPESEGFEAEIVFKGSHFTFYKDGEKVTSGNYRIDYEFDLEPHSNMKDNDEPFYSWFNLNIPEAQYKKIAEATNGKIAPLPKSFAVISYDDRYDAQVLSMNDYCYDGFSYSFVKR